jgi:ferredoxin/flavodoxin---NADP+ reductase
MSYRDPMSLQREGEFCDLIVVGGNLAGLSVAVEASEAGLERVLVLEPGMDVTAPAVVTQHGLRVLTAERPHTLRGGDGGVAVVTDGGEHRATAVVLALRPPVRLGPASDAAFPNGRTVLVVGSGEDAAERAIELTGDGASVVLALGDTDPAVLSRLSRRTLLRLEAERSMTVLWVSEPEEVAEVEGRSVAYFSDSRLPDIVVDEVVYVDPPAPDSFEQLGVAVEGVGEPSMWWACEAEPTAPDGLAVVPPGTTWEAVRRSRFAHLPPPSGRPRVWRPDDAGDIEGLRTAHYNATITRFHRIHPDLWRIQIRPDNGDTAHLAGQYVTLGLGYWEPRADAARDRRLERRWDRLVRRSYSISSPIFDEDGSLIDASAADILEFYIVLVSPTPDHVPALTPRLATKRDGDRIHLGARVVGHYTLEHITDPATQVVLLSTGTGEAPHNAMATELLRRGHDGPIVSVACVRHQRDLGYLDEHRRLEASHPNYHYLPLVTREPVDGGKRYIQDVIADDVLAERFEVDLDPGRTHVYLCGNPAMIGIPVRWVDDGVPVFEGETGVCELLTARGFTLDRRGHRGNVHYEKYW